MKRFLHSVRLRLTLWYAGVLAIVLAVFAASIYVYVVQTAQLSIDQAMESFGQQTDLAAQPVIKTKNWDPKKVHAPAVGRGQPIVGYFIANQLVGTKVVKKGRVEPNYKNIRVAIHSGNDNCGTLSSAGVGKRNAPVLPLRYCIHIIKKHGKAVGGVEVIASLAGIDKALQRLRLALLFGIPFALLLAGSGGWLLAGRALEPVERISSMARTITASDLSNRINLRRQDELGRLAGTFDDMFDRLERAFQEQRQLTADVSHELRSPLTVLEAQTSLALKRNRTPEDYRRVLLSVQEEVEHMSAMVNQLLTLARAEAGEEAIRLEPVALHTIAEPAVDGLQALAVENGVTLSLDAGPNVWALGDAGRLRQLLINLLDNALRHTAPGGTIYVEVCHEAGQPVIRIEDDGEGITPENLPHIFQRFYRGDRARQRAAGNSGLGLAIVRWIVEAHGGIIHVQSTPGQGATFTVVLIPAPAPALRLLPVI
jgi:heavy metal sensor kinase